MILEAMTKKNNNMKIMMNPEVTMVMTCHLDQAVGQGRRHPRKPKIRS